MSKLTGFVILAVQLFAARLNCIRGFGIQIVAAEKTRFLIGFNEIGK